MSISNLRIQNPRGGPLWNNAKSQVRGIAAKKASSDERAQCVPKTEHNERNEQIVIVNDLKVFQPVKTTSDVFHHEQAISHPPGFNACNFCHKNRLRVSKADNLAFGVDRLQCTGGPPCTNCVSRSLHCVFTITPYLENAEAEANLAQLRAQRSPSMDSDAPIPSRVIKSDAKSTHNIPHSIQDRLETWYIKHGRQLPPCATSDTATPPSHHTDGSEALWKLKTGEVLNVSMHTFPGFESSTPLCRKHFLIAQGATFGPHIIRFHYCFKLRIEYKIWLGVDGNKEGFEKDASIIKEYASNTKRKRAVEEDSDLDSESVEVVSKRLNQAKQVSKKSSTSIGASSRPSQQPKASATNLTAKEISEMNARLARLEKSQVSQDVSARTLQIRTKRTSNTAPTVKDTHDRSEVQQPLTKLTTTMLTPQLSNSELRTHILTNAIFLFYDGDDKVVRNKQFCYCNTITKLFNQARVANIFRNPTYTALALRIHGEEGIKYIAEGDDQVS
jgi:hypothetical protein